MGDLPFTINARLDSRGQALFIAECDEQTVTSERYRPGDGVRRRKVALQWARDDRLRNGRLLVSSEICQALEQAEFACLEAEDDIAAEDVECVEAVSHADTELLAELAWDPATAKVDFIVFDRASGHFSRAAFLRIGGRRVVPPSIADGIATPGTDVPGNVLLPTYADPDGEDVGQLRREIASFIDRYVELPAGGTTIGTEYVLLSWMYDAFDELPYIAFRTSFAGRGKSRALETVGSICYRPAFVGGGSTAAATLRIIDIFQGTLVCDEFDQNAQTELAADLNRILNQGFQRNRPLIKCDGDAMAPRPFKCFGPKLFALRQRLGDDATESRTISIWMEKRTRDNIPLNLPRAEFDREALALRNKLLGWRFANHGRIQLDPSLADRGLDDRANQIAVPLLSVAESGAARAAIVAALKEQQAGVAADRGDTTVGQIVAVLLDLYAPGQLIRPQTVREAVNNRRASDLGKDVDQLGRLAVTPHRVGKIIRVELELPRAPKDKAGARYLLTQERAEELAQRYGVSPPATSPSSPGDDAPEAMLPLNPCQIGGCDDGGDGDVAAERAPF